MIFTFQSSSIDRKYNVIGQGPVLVLYGMVDGMVAQLVAFNNQYSYEWNMSWLEGGISLF